MKERNYNMLCKLAFTDEGPSRGTMVKCTNIALVGFAQMDLHKKDIFVEDDEADPNDWTDEEMEYMKRLEKEDEELIIKKLPPAMKITVEKFLK